MEEASKLIEKENIKLIVADSGTGLFRAEYLGRGTLSSRQQKLNHFFHLLVKTAEIYSIAVIVTNQVMHDPGQFFGDPTKAIGGNVVAHTSTYRIYFRKSGKKRVARMVDSPHHPEEEVVFMLTEAGISYVFLSHFLHFISYSPFHNLYQSTLHFAYNNECAKADPNYTLFLFLYI